MMTPFWEDWGAGPSVMIPPMLYNYLKIYINTALSSTNNILDPYSTFYRTFYSFFTDSFVSIPCYAKPMRFLHRTGTVIFLQGRYRKIHFNLNTNPTLNLAKPCIL